MAKKALITGITGQDGSYLSELLLQKGYDEVHGIIRRTSTFNTQRLWGIYQDPHAEGVRFFLHYGDMTDAARLGDLVYQIQPDEVYNLAAQSHVRVSFDEPRHTFDVVACGCLNLLEAVRRFSPEARFYQASSSEMFGKAGEVPQKETTPFHPRSPYAVAKVAAFWLTTNYREAYNLFSCNGILFNHESPRRGETFVTRKITRGLSRIIAGLESKLYLGNLDAMRDWGYAKEYVEAMWLMLQQEKPDDFVVATGETHSVRDFLEACCAILGLCPEEVVEFDPRYLRPAEVDVLCGDSTKARNTLGWEAKVNFTQLVQIMLAADLEEVGINPALFGLEPSNDIVLK